MAAGASHGAPLHYLSGSARRSPWGKLPIDKTPTPSYLSPNHGWLRFASRVGVDLARKVPHFGALEAKSGRGGVIEGVG
jgi:hypothetical protein